MVFLVIHLLFIRCMIFVIVVHDHFRVRYGSVGHESNLDNSVFEDAAPRAMFDEDQEQQHNEPPPMHRSKSSLGAQSRGTLFLHLFFYTFFGCSFNNFFTLLVFHLLFECFTKSSIVLCRTLYSTLCRVSSLLACGGTKLGH